MTPRNSPQFSAILHILPPGSLIVDSSTCVMRPLMGSSVSSTSHDTDWVDMRCWRSAIARC